ncbi:hypothetical protein [Actinomadura rudentiformis]|uniref:Uncharacterized protein n=1 Tax=Actinomadura rudentiformis TaxID=359158 RepID=A0A6H9YN65_9ACTN|nr:hypothetical protein [Actinomadura rudentiformis]KAB2347452.1 hypothetical protein F8566_20860 [Actinomadura rudentiformis]
MTLSALAFLGTACGGDAGGSGKENPSVSGTAPAGKGGGDRMPSMDQQLKFAKCMREHGVDMPDPKPGEAQRGIAIGGKGASAEKIEKALKSCRSVAGIPEPKPISQEQKDRMLKFAQCMRQHGVDMPDPKFDGKGGMAAAQRAPQSEAERVKFDKANRACAAFG